MQFPQHLLVAAWRLGMMLGLVRLRPPVGWHANAERIGDGLFQQAVEFCLVHDDVSLAARGWPHAICLKKRRSPGEVAIAALQIPVIGPSHPESENSINGLGGYSLNRNLSVTGCIRVFPQLRRGNMRSVGLAALLLAVLFLLFPFYRQWVPHIRISTEDSRLLGGLLLAVGGLTLAVFRRRA
jgi:hypothetical protein